MDRATELLTKLCEWHPFVYYELIKGYPEGCVCFMCHEKAHYHKSDCLWLEIENFVKSLQDVETT